MARILSRFSTDFWWKNCVLVCGNGLIATKMVIFTGFMLKIALLLRKKCGFWVEMGCGKLLGMQEGASWRGEGALCGKKRR
jgi:hypothetical protein